MGKWILLLGAGLFLAAGLGCEVNPMCRVAAVNTEIALGEAVRFVGLDSPSMLHMRDTVPDNYYTPYR